LPLSHRAFMLPGDASLCWREFLLQMIRNSAANTKGRIIRPGGLHSKKPLGSKASHPLGVIQLRANTFGGRRVSKWRDYKIDPDQTKCVTHDYHPGLRSGGSASPRRSGLSSSPVCQFSCNLSIYFFTSYDIIKQNLRSIKPTLREYMLAISLLSGSKNGKGSSAGPILRLSPRILPRQLQTKPLYRPLSELITLSIKNRRLPSPAVKGLRERGRL
jgi:hypothetical protein